MHKKIGFILSFLCTFFFSFSQTDSTSKLDDVYLPAKEISTEKNSGEKRFGASIFGGIGIGGNWIKQGFARGLDASFHYHFHTIDVYVAQTTEHESDYSYSGTKDRTLTYDASNFGLSYGCGIYENHYSAAAVIGVGHTNTYMRVRNLSLSPYSLFLDKRYIRTCGVIGAQASIRGKYFGLSAKGYCNIFDGPSNYTVLFGIEVILR